MKKVLLFVLIVVSVLDQSQAQSCTATTYNFDLSSSIDTTVSIQSNRNGDCCGGTNCIRFNLILNPACSYVNFTVANPAPPGNAAYYQVNCGPPTSLGTPICIIGLSSVTITFCKPGNDNPIYTITAAGALQGSPDVTVREGCTTSLGVSGLTLATINWTSIYPGTQGAYDSYLSCTSGCATTNVTPMPGAPAYIDYRVGGNRICGPVVYDTIRVYTTPQIAVSVSPVSSTICSGSSTTFTATASGGDAPYNYVWSNGQSGQSITANIAGVYTVSVTDTRGCIPATQSATLTVATTPVAPTASNNSALCAGSSLNLFASAVPNATYSWTGPNGFTSSLQSPVINNVSLANAGSYSVNVTVGQCTSAMTTTNVIINPIPSAPGVSGNSPVCEGSTLNLVASLVPGATYNWTGPNGFNSTNQNININNAGIPNAGTYTVAATINGCTSIAAPIAAVVKALPTAPIVSANSPICDGSSINLSASNFSNASYLWTGPNGFSSSAQNPVISNAGSIASGTYSVTATINGCTGPAGSTSVIVNPVPPAPYIISNAPLCAGSTLSISASTITGASYSWTGPNNFIASTQNNSLSSVSSVNSGIYSVKATVNGCSSTPASTAVIINQPALTNAGPNQNICSSNQFVNVTGTISGGTNTGTWATTGEGYFSSNTNLSTHYYPSASDKIAGQVTLSLTSTNNGACPGSSSSMLIRFSAASFADAGSDQTICANNGPVSLSGQFSNSNGITWSTSGTGTFSPSRYDVNATYIPGSLDKTYGRINLILKTTGATPCPDVSDTLLLVLKPAPEIKTSPVKYVLENNSTVLDPTVSGSKLKYSWTPDVFLNNSTLVNPVCAPKADINYTLVASDDFGCVSSAEIFVKVLKLPDIPNVFTPNGDGINERWEIKYLKDYPECTVEIFNRYGQLVYQSTGYSKEWDGTLNGKPLPAGTFYYIINLKMNMKPLAGFVDIVR